MQKLALTLLVLLLSAAGLPTTAAARQPNFVFFLVDDLGYMDIGANNPDCFYDTPHLDRLAASGMRFTDGYAACQVCSPTRYSIMTGRYPARAKATNFFSGQRTDQFRSPQWNDFMAPQEVTIAESLRQHGYRTAFFGKWHLGPEPEYWPEQQGFELNFGGFRAGSPPGGYFAPFKNPRLADRQPGEHLPARLADEAVQVIDQFGDQPFLLYLSFYSVHTPLQGRPDLVEKYQQKLANLPPVEEFGEEQQVWQTADPRRVRIAQRHAVYAAMVEAMDQAVGRVLGKIEQAGLADDTVVFFTSDNGGLSTSEGSPTSNLPLRAGKGWMYEGGIREPLLVRAPGVTPPGSVCQHPVVSTDFYPTMLQLADAPLQPQLHTDGVSLVPLLSDPAAKLPREALFWHYPHYSNQGGFPASAVRVGPWKLIQRLDDGSTQLFNLQRDLGEHHDLASEQPQRVQAMQQRLLEWYQQVDAQFLRPLEEGGPQPWQPGRAAAK